MDKFNRINRIIDRNPAKFSGRAKITSQWLQHTFDWLVPGIAEADPSQTRDAHKFVSAYTTVNKALALRGQYLKARNYYTSYQLCNTKPTVAIVESCYRTTSIAKNQKASILRQGYNKHAGLWQSLTPNELASLRR